MKFLTTLLALALTMTVGQAAFAVGTSVLTQSTRVLDHGRKAYVYKVVWTADASAATVPDVSLPKVHGYLVKAITNPGSTAPTDDYDITIADADDATLDAAKSTLINRDTANTEAVYPVSSAGVPLYFQPGTYTLSIANNAVNSATGVIWLYFIDEPGGVF